MFQTLGAVTACALPRAAWALLAVLTIATGSRAEEGVSSGDSAAASATRKDFREISRPLSEFPELPALTPAVDDWPWWRGPQRNNHAPTHQTLPPLAADKVHWREPVIGRGHASPVICGNTVYLATAEAESRVQSLVAYQLATGKLLWQTRLHNDGFQKDSHRNNSFASATPACDGQRVFTAFIHDLGLWVSAVDPQGKILWQTRAGDFDSIYGFGMAPALWGPLVIVNGDNDRTGAFLAALHRQTGELVWKIKRPSIDTYGTPIVANLAGRDQLVLGGGGFVTSYAPATGKLLWKCAGPTTETTANSATFSADTVFITGGYPKPYIAMGIRATGLGNVDDTHVLWTNQRAMSYVPSPLFADGLLYVLNDDGVITCLDSVTGKPLFSKRLGGDYSASPLLVDGKIVLCSEQGLVTVIAAGREFKQLSQLDLVDPIFATPASTSRGLIIRTFKALICFGG